MAHAREIKTTEEAKAAIRETAADLGITVEELLDPRKAPGFAERSPLFRDVLNFFGNGDLFPEPPDGEDEP